MKKPRFTDGQSISVPKRAEAGTLMSQLCPEHNVSSTMSCDGHGKFGGAGASMMSQLDELLYENQRLRTVYAGAHLSVSRPAFHRHLSP